MKKIANIFLILFSIFLFQSCENDQFESSHNYVTFGSPTISTGVDPGSSTDVTIKVYATQTSGVDRSFNVAVDPDSNAAAGSYSVPASVMIPAGAREGAFTVTLSDVDLGIGVNKLTLNFSDVLGGHDAGGSTTIEYIQNCTEVSGTLELGWDQWGSEVSWEIRDALDGVVASGGGYSNAGPVNSDTIAITLCAGRSYTLITTDDYGDGWGAPGNYTLTIGGVVKVQGDGSLMNDGGGNGAISASAAFDTN